MQKKTYWRFFSIGRAPYEYIKFYMISGSLPRDFYKIEEQPTPRRFILRSPFMRSHKWVS